MKICIVCNNKYKSNSNRQKVCEKCSTTICIICGNKKKQKQYIITRKTCSFFCAGKYKTFKAKINCYFCNKTFISNRKSRKYCSRICQYKSFEKSRPGLSKEKHWAWKGGISGENRNLRSLVKYNEWRNAIYMENHWTCILCEKRLRSKDIVAHHIKIFSQFPEYRYDINNGITLCRGCHLYIHKYDLKPYVEAVKEVLENEKEKSNPDQK